MPERPNVRWQKIVPKTGTVNSLPRCLGARISPRRRDPPPLAITASSLSLGPVGCGLDFPSTKYDRNIIPILENPITLRPNPDPETITQISLQITMSKLAEIDAHAKQWGVSRVELFRRCVSDIPGFRSPRAQRQRLRPSARERTRWSDPRDILQIPTSDRFVQISIGSRAEDIT